MAVRSATRRYPDLLTFLREYPKTLKVNAITLPPGTVEGELAQEIKLDILIPFVGRVGPVDAQVVFRMPDGAIALRLPYPPPELTDAIAQVMAIVDAVGTWLLEERRVVLPTDAVALQKVTAERDLLKRNNEQLQRDREGLQGEREALSAQISALRAGGAVPQPGQPIVASGTLQPGGRGYPFPDLTHTAPTLSGSLSDRSLRDAFMMLAIEKLTGIVTLTYENGTVRRGFWEKGGPVGWRTDPVDEQEVLGILLFRAKQITKEQFAQSLEAMERTGGRQGEALIDAGLITYPQLVLLLQKQADFVLQRVLKDREGTWTFHAVDRHIEKFVAPPVKVAAMMFRALRTHAKEMPSEQLAVSLRPNLDRYVFLGHNVERTIEEMKLSMDEQQFIKILTSTSYRLREIFSVSNLPRSGTAGMLWCLTDLGLIEYRNEEAAKRSGDRLEKYVQDRKRQMLKGTLFERMEVHWICTRAEVEAAWARLSPEIEPDALARYDEPIRGELEKIAGQMREAYTTLIDDKRRREYRAGVFEKMMIDQSAEMLAKKGDMAIMKGLQKEALECFLKAQELHPHNTDIRAGLERAKKM